MFFHDETKSCFPKSTTRRFDTDGMPSSSHEVHFYDLSVSSPHTQTPRTTEKLFESGAIMNCPKKIHYSIYGKRSPLAKNPSIVYSTVHSHIEISQNANTLRCTIIRRERLSLFSTTGLRLCYVFCLAFFRVLKYTESIEQSLSSFLWTV